jgi:hypothetical protein
MDRIVKKLIWNNGEVGNIPWRGSSSVNLVVMFIRYWRNCDDKVCKRLSLRAHDVANRP